MRYRNLGRAGVKVSTVGVGCNRLGRGVDQEGSNAIVRRALDAGINFFDTADIYGAAPGDSETMLGNALAGLWDRVVLATKVRAKVGSGPNDVGASRHHILNGVEASLRHLRTDHIDLYYIHEWDQETPVEETLAALDDLVRSGKVRYIGASNFASWQLCHANDLAELRGWASFVVTQEEYHMLERSVEREIVPYCRYAGVGIVPYFPLAGGLLTGKYSRGQTVQGRRAGYIQPYLTEANMTILDQLHTFAESRGHTMGDLAIAWLLGEPQVCSVISGATNADQVTANAPGGDWELTAEELQQLRRILESK